MQIKSYGFSQLRNVNITGNTLIDVNKLRMEMRKSNVN